MEKLVSILTPCYNGEKYIWRLLDSILHQTYPRIEMFVIDDGSTDNSAKLIKSYISKFEKKGYFLRYIYQENCGASGAINAGLQYIDGEYLVWPDADDWYNSDTAIADLVEVFENSSENVGLVRGLQYLRNEKTLKIIGKNGDENKIYPKKLFKQCMFGDGDWWYTPGGNMVKTKHFFYYYPNKKIYSDYRWQNIQLQFPILFDYDCITINKYIYNTLVNFNSDSRKQVSYVVKIKREEGLRNMCISVLDIMKNMSLAEKEKYKCAIQDRYNENLFYIFLFHKKYKDAQSIFFKVNLNSKKKIFTKFIKILIKKLLNFIR